MSEWIPIIITACGAAIVSGAFTLINNAVQRKAEKKEDKNEKLDALVEAQQLIMLDRIKWLGQAYINTGKVDFDDRRLLNKMHAVYHDKLGGNGDLDVIMKEVNKLPLKKEA